MKAPVLAAAFMFVTACAWQAKAWSRGCSIPADKIYVGALWGAGDLADPAGTAALRQSRIVSFYLTSYALTQIRNLDPAAIRATWSGSGPGIIEVGTDEHNMAEIDSSFRPYIDQQHGWTWGSTKGVDWPAILRRTGWQPQIAMLNVFEMGNSGRLSDPYYLMNKLAVADVRRLAPSIKVVLPYLTANRARLDAATGGLKWTDAYWAESRSLARLAGGLGLDTPANYFLLVREKAYRELVVQQIQWARANGLMAAVLLSPYDMKAPPGTAPQFQFDGRFVEAVREEAGYLHRHAADPTFYVATNYSEAPTNRPGRAGDPETIDTAALWLLRNASVVAPRGGCDGAGTSAPRHP